MANYFFDAVNGSDANNGSTWALAFKTLDSVSKVTYPAGPNCLYFNTGVYFLNANATISTVSGPMGNAKANATFVIGIGSVVFKNPNRKLLTLSLPGSSDLDIEMTVANINFNTPVGGELLDIFHVQWAYSWSSFNSAVLNFINCSFRRPTVKIIRTTGSSDVRTNVRNINCNNCTCLSDSALTTASTNVPILSLPANHVLKPATAYTGIASLFVQAEATRRNTENGVSLSNGTVAGVASDTAVSGSFPAAFVSYNKTGTWVDFPHTELIISGMKFANWFDDTSYAPGRIAINTTLNEVSIASGLSARVLSPVLKYGVVSTLKRLSIVANEVSTAPYDNAVVDSTHGTTTRTYEYRASLTAFLPSTDEVTLPWVTADRNTNIDAANVQYIQFRVTLDAMAS